MMMRSLRPLRARSSYATEKSFLIVRRRLNRRGLLWKVQDERPEARLAGDAQYAPLSAAYSPDDTRNCGWNRFAHRPFLNWGSDQTRDYAALQKHDRYLRHDHNQARGRPVSWNAHPGECSSHIAIRRCKCDSKRPARNQGRGRDANRV